MVTEEYSLLYYWLWAACFCFERLPERKRAKEINQIVLMDPLHVSSSPHSSLHAPLLPWLLSRITRPCWKTVAVDVNTVKYVSVKPREFLWKWKNAANIINPSTGVWLFDFFWLLILDWLISPGIWHKAMFCANWFWNHVKAILFG